MPFPAAVPALVRPRVTPCRLARRVLVAAQHRDSKPERSSPESTSHDDVPAQASSSGVQPARRSEPEDGKPYVLLSTLLASGLLGLLPDLGGPFSTLEAILILCGIVTFHELGHFLAARLQGIHVSKFAVGFGPTLLSRTVDGVEYSLRALPLGGFVGFPDNDEDSPYAKDDPNLLKNRPILDRFFVISAGVVFNMILAYTAVTAQVANFGYADVAYRPGVRVPVVLPRSAAAEAGIKQGDIILALDDEPVGGADAVKAVVSKIKAHRDISIDFAVLRDGQVQHVMVLPEVAPDGGGRIGVQLSNNATVSMKKTEGVADTLARATAETGRLVNTTVSGLGGLLTNPAEASQTMSGPIAVVAVGAEVARASPSGLFSFAAVVNINLAIVNVLPLPALDGGYLLLLLIEAARREKLPESVEQAFVGSGFLLLMGLGLLLVVKDTLNILPK